MYRLARKKIALTCVILLVLTYSGGIFASWISPHDYEFQDYGVINKSPIFVTDGGFKAFWKESHFAGTDRFGRDMFTRVLWGIQNTAVLTLIGMLSGGLVIGVSLGLISGYAGGKIDSLIMRVGEIFSSFPDILLAIILAATLRPRVVEIVRWLEDHSELDGLVKSGVADYVVISLALVSFGWIGMARLVRGQILALKQTQHVEAARAIGASTSRILARHLLPNALSPIVVSVSMSMGSMVGVEIILSWLGIGIQPPRPSLGLMLFEGGVNLSILRNWPWLLLAPGCASWIMVLSWNLLGDAINDVLNPRTR
jgi:ABC-type dipeptide/oligopeptide/nickel transport system permease subunit